MGGSAEGRGPDVFQLLTDRGAQEWQHRVGVVGGSDGSAKGTTRLLEAGGWLIKTDLSRARATPDDLVRDVSALVELARKTRLWHDRKVWFLMRATVGWLPCSACPVLRTVRECEGWDVKSRAWTRMIEIGLEAASRHDVLLDLNPSNFGFHEDPANWLYYLDDECYPTPRMTDFGGRCRCPNPGGARGRVCAVGRVGMPPPAGSGPPLRRCRRPHRVPRRSSRLPSGPELR